MSSIYTQQFTIAANHPAFSGHFPSFPILPAVVELSLLQETLSSFHQSPCTIIGLPFAKFLHPIKPNTVVNIELTILNEGSGNFIIRIPQHLAAKGRLLFKEITL
ncbi:MAG: hypothetical protein Q9M31_10465 [Mariprofundus sp.]|nr:hypothetical protein [Mariprofundus sp.]